MSYQVLARKYRPQTFAEVIGQDHVVQTLRNAIQTKRIAHAYLFVGPRGIGKTSTARILAKALNSPNGPNADFDPDADICKEIAEGRCLDVIEIDGASNNGVDHVRDLRDNVRYSPVQGRYKIYIIDEVHMLSTAAFNALLKTLEEPPAHIVFIFATTEVHKVLPTILSRCQRFDLRRLTEADIIKQLSLIAKQERINIAPEALTLLARQAEGGMRDAESALDQLISFCGSNITENDVLSIFGLTARTEIRKLAEAIINGEEQQSLLYARTLTQQDKDLSRLSQELLRYFRNMLLFRISPEIAKEELDSSDLDYFHAYTNPPANELLLAFVEELLDLENRLRFALVKEVIFELTLIRLAQQRRKVSLEAVLRAVTSGNPPPPSEPQSIQKPSPVETQSSSYQQASPPPPPKPANIIQETPKAPAPKPIAKKAPPQKMSEKDFQNDPLIQKALKEFNAKVIQVKS